MTNDQKNTVFTLALIMVFMAFVVLLAAAGAALMPTGEDKPVPHSLSAGTQPQLDRCQEDEVHITSRANGCVTIDDLPLGNVRSAAESITTKCKPGTGWVDPTPHSTEVVAWCTTYQR